MKSRFLVWCLSAVLGVASLTNASRSQTTTTAPATSSSAPFITSGGSANTTTTQANLINNTPAGKVMTSGKGSATSIPSNTNPFVSSYIDPLSVGMPSKFTTFVTTPVAPTGTFGTPLYQNTTSAANAPKGGATTQQNQLIGFTTAPTPRAPVYTTVLADDVPRIVHNPSDLHAKVQAMIDRSTYLKSKAGVRISVDGATVQLQGQVASDRERKMVEGMVRTQPGVQDVQNLLQILVPAR